MKFMKFDNHTEKLVGTGFCGHVMRSFGDSRVFDGWIVPEPIPCDKHAKSVMIMVPTGNGTQRTAIKVGYLKKDGWLYNRVKVCSQKWEPCRVEVSDSNESCTVIVGEA